MAKGDWDPGAKYRKLISQIQDILDNGEQRTVRDVYYALEARGNKWEYRYVKRAVKKGRRAGYVDPEQIIDSSRQPVNTVSDGWDHPREFLERRVREIWNDYWENFWKYQDTYVEVWLEKQSLASLFKPICQRHHVRLEATRGDWSDSEVYATVRRLVGMMRDGKDVEILYFGDFNPSGYHAPVSILDRMGYYGVELVREFPDSADFRYYDPEWKLPARFRFEDTGEEHALNLTRCAINQDHIKRFDLPENPVPSGSDKDATIKRHFQEHVSEGLDTNVELNALKEFERDFLETLIEESITEHVDDEVREAVDSRINQGQDALAEAVQIDPKEIELNFYAPIGPPDWDGDRDE